MAKIVKWNKMDEIFESYFSEKSKTEVKE